ncbi:MAG: response regulator transcription factor [Bacteroidia bacterium]|nr:response regulator transcription factor [Bacteroidia bacterium]
MNVIIIEDEQYAAEDLQKNINLASPDIKILAILNSVKEATTYLKNNPHPDLFFSDIQLGDGLSFDIFKSIKTSAPVIFITAFDEYALSAFNSNGVDYILKPFTAKTITDAVNKFKTLTTPIKSENNIDKLLSYLQTKEKRSGSILVYHRDKIIPLNADAVALLYAENEVVKVLCFDGKQFVTNNTLEESEKALGLVFFRANRQHLINRKSIVDVSQHFGRKLLLNLSINYPEKILVSKERSTTFLSWLSNN